MENKKRKRGKRFLKVVAMILGIIVFLGFTGFAINKIFFSNELEAIAPFGQMV